MPYAEGRVFHDADSHVMETPDWLVPYADPPVRARMRPLFVATVRPGEETLHRRAPPAPPRSRRTARASADEIMLRKNWSATGSFLKEDRPRALDLLGFSSQLVFNTFLNKYLLDAERGDDLDFAYGLARAHNRAIADFCAVDRAPARRPATCRSRTSSAPARWPREAIALGCKALLVAVGLPARTTRRATSGLFPVWAHAEEARPPDRLPRRRRRAAPRPELLRERPPAGARLPRRRRELPLGRLHGDPLPAHADARDADHRRRARPLPAPQDRRDRAGRVVGAELDAHHRLGASRRSARTRSASSSSRLRPSEYVRRQVRVTPYPAEHVGWIVANAGEEVCLFSLRLPARRGRPQPDAALRGEHRRRLASARSSASTATTSST